MRVEHVKVIDLTPDQLDRCRELSFGDDGYMCEDLDDILECEQGWCYRYSQAILLVDAEEIIGWSLMQPIYRRPKYTAHFFVDPGHRGNGYGRLLLQAANQWCNRPLCYLDQENRGFFERYPALHDEYIEKDIAV